MIRIITATILTVTLVTAVVTGGCDTGQAPEVGKPAPDFEFKTADGEAQSLSQLRGRLVLINS